jgi:GNAT superfamily N-acetyltransferase
MEAWIAARPLSNWRPETKEFRTDEYYVRLQRSRYYDQTGTILGITLTNIEVKPTLRRKGYATRIIGAIEVAAFEHGLSYVMIQAISSEEMDQLANKMGYESMPNSDDSSFIKRSTYSCTPRSSRP